MANSTSPTRTAPAGRSLGGNGTRAGPAGVAPPRSRVRLPELAVGIFVTVGFALGAVLWHLNSVERVPALAAASTIERGDTVTAADLRVIYVASDDALVRLDESQATEVVGRVALVDLPAGTLLTAGLVEEAGVVSAGEGIAGLALDPGQYPAGLAVGDRVNVVAASDATVDTDSDGAVIARGATVVAVEDLASDRRLVSVMASEADVEAVAAGASSGTLRLVLVAP